MALELQTEATDALEDLRDLARGIYPPLLADEGLSVALEAQARRSVVPVTVDAGGIGRYPREVESAVYFCALEALNNVAKYADASSATIRLSQTNGSLAFEVVDDGRGFDGGDARRNGSAGHGRPHGGGRRRAPRDERAGGRHDRDRADPRREPPVRTRAPWLLVAFGATLIPPVLWLSIRNGSFDKDGPFIVIALVTMAGWATVGALLASRNPTNPIGWLMIAFGVGFVLAGLGDEWTTYAYVTDPGTLPLGPFFVVADATGRSWRSSP